MAGAQMTSWAPNRAGQNSSEFLRALKAQHSGKIPEAERLYKKALKLNPECPNVLANYGVLLDATGRIDDGIEYIKKSLTIDPSVASRWFNLSALYYRKSQFMEAAAAGMRAIELEPDNVRALNSVGAALCQVGQYEVAKQTLQAALRLEPTYDLALANIGLVHQAQSRVDEAIACFAEAIGLNPTLSWAYSNMIFYMHFSGRYTPQEIAAAHRGWATYYEKPLLSQALPRRDVAKQDKPLRIGMVSADLRRHPVMDFLSPIVRNWPKERFELYFYSNSWLRDDVTEWLAGEASGWRDVAGLSHEALARKIRADQIDVLFDLTGHTADNRLLTFAYKPAPVQVTWLGYTDTSGMESMDFIVANSICIPTAEADLYAERIVHLPNSFVCYEPPAWAPEVGPLPAMTDNSPITFGSQNQVVKLNDAVIDLWARVLHAVPGSRLLLAGKAFGDESAQLAFQQKFAVRGVEADRLILRPGQSKQGVFSTYNEIDIVLDPFPCGGGTTTCEALWMGVPVVTLYADRFTGRHSASHLTMLGLEHLVARNEDEYIEAACRLAADVPGLAALRAGLRDTMRSSPLCDAAAFVNELADTIDLMWDMKRSAC